MVGLAAACTHLKSSPSLLSSSIRGELLRKIHLPPLPPSSPARPEANFQESASTRCTASGAWAQRMQAVAPNSSHVTSEFQNLPRFKIPSTARQDGSYTASRVPYAHQRENATVLVSGYPKKLVQFCTTKALSFSYPHTHSEFPSFLELNS